MKKYLELKNEYETRFVVDEIENHCKLKFLSTPKEVDDARVNVTVELYAPKDLIFVLSGKHDLVQNLLDMIYKQKSEV